jgi:hypothetical protein
LTNSTQFKYAAVSITIPGWALRCTETYRKMILWKMEQNFKQGQAMPRKTIEEAFDADR